MRRRISMPAVLVLLVAGCAQTQGAAPGPGERDATHEGFRCWTELVYQPGPLGTMGQSTPVQKCEPIEVPTLPAGAPPNPGGTPAPTTQTVPAPPRDVPAKNNP
jgi:hypothetical protein